MTEDDLEELLERAQELQAELNEMHQARMARTDPADDKLAMFRKQVSLSSRSIKIKNLFKCIIEF